MADHDPHLRPVRNPPARSEDYAAWLNRQLHLLRDRAFDELDLDKLVEEVSDLGTSDFKSFVSAIEIVIAHMLKWDHRPERRSYGWIASIEEHRARIEQDLADSPSYRARAEEAVRRAYRPACALAARGTDLPVKTYPDTCPYGWADLIGRDHVLDR